MALRPMRRQQPNASLAELKEIGGGPQVRAARTIGAVEDYGG
nr:hypothetical protein [uncultured Shinella sp.]